MAANGITSFQGCMAACTLKISSNQMHESVSLQTLRSAYRIAVAIRKMVDLCTIIGKKAGGKIRQLNDRMSATVPELECYAVAQLAVHARIKKLYLFICVSVAAVRKTAVVRLGINMDADGAFVEFRKI